MFVFFLNYALSIIFLQVNFLEKKMNMAWANKAELMHFKTYVY